MDWETLKTMHCPRCGSKLQDGKIGYVCKQETTQVCRFQISYERFQEVVRDMYKPKKKILYDPDAIDRSDWE